MSRVAKAPVAIPKGVDVKLEGNHVTIKGSKGQLSFNFNSSISIEVADNAIQMIWNSDDKIATSQAGTARAIVNNMMTGVSAGYEKKLALVGVGYRAQAKDKVLNLSVGYSHPIDYVVPEGITIETPSQTDIVIKGSDKQLVGEVAAKIRSFRQPEPYKGKGIRYADEIVARKEAKKK